jgi:DNA-directed RNA polymerase subunit L
MKIRVVNRTKNNVKIEIEGEGHTFCNILQKTLLLDRDVEYAGYNVPHPLTNNSFVELKVKGSKKAEKILISSAKKIESEAKEFEEKIEAALAKYSPRNE